MPVSFCDVTSSTAPVATAASIALPPCRRISSPASAASGSLVATMPWRASTSDRPCASQPCARDPGTALMSAPGCGLSAVGMPKAFGDCAALCMTQRAKHGHDERNDARLGKTQDGSVESGRLDHMAPLPENRRLIVSYFEPLFFKEIHIGVGAPEARQRAIIARR